QTDLKVLVGNDGHQHLHLADRIAALDRLAGTAVLAAATIAVAWLLATQSSIPDAARMVAGDAYQATFGSSAAEAGRLNPASLTAPLTAADVRTLQSRLSQRGFDPGRIDGIAGKRTLDALNLYRAAKNLQRASSIDRATIADLLD